jgi:hypothetical protein
MKSAKSVPAKSIGMISIIGSKPFVLLVSITSPSRRFGNQKAIAFSPQSAPVCQSTGPSG